MKTLLKYFGNNTLFLVVVAISILFSSCEKKENDEAPDWQYLVSLVKEKTIPSSASVTTLTLLTYLYPDDTTLSTLVENATYNVDVYSITYNTTFKGQDILASGLVCVPSVAEQFPIISFQNGTNTKHDNAPSVNLYGELFSLLQSLASNGFILIAPDYIGFGASSQVVHPYYQKETNNRAITDMLLAVKELLSGSVAAQFNDDLYLMGYSQGGWATLAAHHEIEKNHPDYKLKATSCGAGAYNLTAMSDYIFDQETYPGPLYLPYFIYSHQEFGSINLQLNQVFNEPYASKIPDLFDGSRENAEVNAELNDTIQRLLTPEFLSGLCNETTYDEICDDLEKNGVSGWLTSAKIRFYHGTADLNVPPQESENIYDEFKAAGCEDNIELFNLEEKDHGSGTVPWGINTILWFSELKQ